MTQFRSRPALRVLLILGVAVAVVLVAVWSGRRILAREALTAWLRAHGVSARTEVQALGLGAFAGAVTLGDPKAPDFAADQVRVTYALRGLGVEVSSVTLVHPVVRARLHGGAFSLGALDPLIAELRKRPARPGSPKPRITIERGVVLLTTDYGPVTLDAEALVAGGKLVRLDARAAPARLTGPDFDAVLGAGTFSLRTVNDKVTLTLDATLPSAGFTGVRGDQARIKLAATVPYPDLDRRRAEGAVTVQAALSGGVNGGGRSLKNVTVAAAFDGTAAGGLADLLVRGRADTTVLAARADLAGARAQSLSIEAASDDLRWARKSGDSLSGAVRLNGKLATLTAPSLTFRTVSAAFAGSLLADRGGTSAHLAGTVGGHGGWSGLGGPSAQDSREIAAVKRAARGFRFKISGFTFDLDRGAASSALSKPLRIAPDSGGAVELAPRGRGYRLTSQGGGLPAIDATAERVTIAGGAITARGHAKAALSIGPVEDGIFEAAGALRSSDGLISFTAARCVAVQAAGIALGANEVGAISARLCPTTRPLFTLRGDDWRLDGRAEAVAAEVPFAQARIEDGAGTLELRQAAGRLDAGAVITQARVADSAPTRRFQPLTLTGRAGLTKDILHADLALADLAGRGLANARLSSDTVSGVGGVEVNTGTLKFANGGLQPSALSPLAAAIGSPVTGSAVFTGRFAWTPNTATSEGRLTVPGLDFESPVGRVSGLKGEVAFTSLAPLTTAPGQILTAVAVSSPAGPLSDLKATFSLSENALEVSGGQALMGGGKLRVEGLEIPLALSAPIRGALQFEGVQLHDLIAASPFADKVEFDARVTGDIPFEVQGGKVRVAGGALHTIQPGRLSIKRAALTGVSIEGAGGAVTAGPAPSATVPANDAFTDFAYQAMEHLAFDKLDATIASKPDGRLGVLFHIVGLSDPPQHQEIRLTLMDLIRRRFLDKPLPLPSGTGVDLTLDTTLNIDDLLGDYAGFQRLRGSSKVQP